MGYFVQPDAGYRKWSSGTPYAFQFDNTLKKPNLKLSFNDYIKVAKSI
jgi:hypothetical protein